MKWILLVLAVFVSSRGVVAAVTEGGVEVGGIALVGAEPGALLTYPVRVENSSSLAQDLKLDVLMPAGWSLVITPVPMNIAAGSARTQIIAMRVPATADAGRHTLRVAALEAGSGKLLDAHSVGVEVFPQPELVISFATAPTRATSGEEFDADIEVTNIGNSGAIISLDVRTTPIASVVVDKETFPLAAGQTRRLRASVSPRASGRGEVTYRLSAVARVVSEPDIVATASHRVLVTDPGGRPTSSSDVTPLNLTLRSLTGRSRLGLQAQLQIEGAPVTSTEDRLDLLIRLPENQSGSTFSERDEYRARYQRKGLDVRLGDNAYELSTLTETGRFGFGVGAGFQLGNLEFGGFLETDRRRYVDQAQQAAYIGTRIGPASRLRVNILNRAGLSTGLVGSAQAEIQLVKGLLVDLEAGRGFGRNGGGGASSVAASGRFNLASFDLRMISADPDYVGRNGDRRLRQVSAVVTPGPLKFSGSWLDEERVLGRLGQREVGTRWTRAFRLEGRANLTVGQVPAFLRINHQARSYEVQTAGSGQRAIRRTQFILLGGGIRLKGLRFGAETQQGKASNLTVGGWRPFTVVSGSISRPGRVLSTTVTLSKTTGAIFAGFDDQRRYKLSVQAGWSARRGTQLSARIFSVSDRLSSERSSMVGQFRFQQSFRNGTTVGFQARTYTVGSSAIGPESAEYAVTVTRPVGWERLRQSRQPRITGRVTDAETGQGMAGVWVRVAGQTAVTDAGGEYSLRAVDEGEHQVTFDRLSAGIEYVPMGDWPRAVTVAGDDVTGVNLALARRGQVAGTVRLLVRPEGTPTFAQADLEISGGYRGLVVQLTDPLGAVRRVSSPDGSINFQGLRPGTYDVDVWEGSAPQGHDVEAPGTIEVSPGGTASMVIRLVPRERELRMVSAPRVRD